MGYTRSRARLAGVFLAAALSLLPAPLSAQQYLSRLFSPETAAAATLRNHEQMVRDSVVALARAQIGTRYRWGGERPEEGFDCSGLVRYIMSALNLSLPRTAHLQSLVGREVARDPDKLQPGDLLTFGRGSRITHIGIYIGNGRYVHASTSRREVVEAEIGRNDSLMRSWRGVRRLLGFGSDSAPREPAG
jgi:cell wall-associated NlpC family hydrolase